MIADLPASLRPSIAEWPGSRIREVADAGRDHPRLIALWFGESDQPTPAFIREAATRALTEGHTLYAPNSGIPQLRQAIADYATHLRGRRIALERVTVTASGVAAIMLAMQALVDAGDNAVLVTPLWPNCADAVHVLGGEVRRVPLRSTETGWRLDLDRLFDACDARTRVIFVNSPGNPTGWMATSEDLATIVAFARRRRIWVMADEVYERLVYDRPKAPSVLDHAGPDDPVIAVNSFSKSWCMTGWRVGWLIHPPAMLQTFAKLNEVNIAGPTTFAQHAGVSAIRDGEPFIAEMVAGLARSRDVVTQRLGGFSRVRMARPDAAFYAFFQVDGMGDSLDFAKRLVADTGVGVAPGIAFGPEGEGWLRLCFATSPARLSEALDRIAPALS